MKYTPETPPTYFRLSDETWARVVEDYANGGQARDVAAKWKTTASSVYRHASLAKVGKRATGDARARAHARAVEDEDRAYRGLNPVGARALKGLFAPARADDPDAGDPAALMRVATLASGRAMRGRLWAEARSLASLAESYRRLAAGDAGPAAGRDDGRWRGPPVSDEEEGAMRDALLRRITALAARIPAPQEAEPDGVADGLEAGEPG